MDVAVLNSQLAVSPFTLPVSVWPITPAGSRQWGYEMWGVWFVRQQRITSPGRESHLLPRRRPAMIFVHTRTHTHFVLTRKLRRAPEIAQVGCMPNTVASRKCDSPQGPHADLGIWPPCVGERRGGTTPTRTRNLVLLLWSPAVIRPESLASRGDSAL